MQIPFDIISCSWPRPVEQLDGHWASEPEWDAPLMPVPPQPHWERIHDEWCWTINWRDLFRGGLKWGGASTGGEMRGFHVVFRLRIKGNGKLVFWDDDGCVIRRNGEVIHCDRSAHMLTRKEIAVSVGDLLEVAQWQLNGEWQWGAWLTQRENNTATAPAELLLPYRDSVQQRLRHPDGPPLKMYSHGRTPVRAVVSLYSMILNGYVPSKVFIFGEDQWTGQARELFASMLPFAEIIPAGQVIKYIQSIGGPRLAQMARRYWYVMKTFISLLYPPEECCSIDDDVFILDRVDDALAAFQRCDLVFAQDTDHGRAYLATWSRVYGRLQAMHTGRFNAGLYWIRNSNDPRIIANLALQSRPGATVSYVWEQGFIATLYTHKNTCPLPTQRYFYPLFDGLPGGMLGYDYALNPCGFASVHFGGLAEKPSDDVAIHLAPDILSRYQRHREEYSDEQSL